VETKNTPTLSFNFSGNIPMHYDRYLGPLYFEPYALEIAKRIDPSLVKIALEIACGTGRVTRHLRTIIPSTSKLIASDISPDMVGVAKEKLKTADIDWQIFDAQDLPIDDNSIDLVVCCFGFMFVPDKLKAFSEIYRILKPGGTFLFSTWDSLEFNGASFVHRNAARKYLEDLTPESYLLPFSMNDDNMIKKALREVGFLSIIIERVDKVAASPTAKEAAFGIVRGGPFYNELMKRNPAWIDELQTAVEKELVEKFGASPMAAPMRALVIDAKK